MGRARIAPKVGDQLIFFADCLFHWGAASGWWLVMVMVTTTLRLTQLLHPVHAGLGSPLLHHIHISEVEFFKVSYSGAFSAMYACFYCHVHPFFIHFCHKSCFY